MSSPSVGGVSPVGNAAPEASDLFQELWSRLKECHDSALQALQSKVSRLRRDRSLDAQRLEEFYNRNRQLREQQRVAQDTIKVLEDRLQAGPCDRCAITEEHMKKKQIAFENTQQKNLHIIAELKTERSALRDENSKLCLELERLRRHGSPQAMSPDLEDGMIPDSPLQSLSLPVVSKMKRRKEPSHVRYAERPLSQSLMEPTKAVPAVAIGFHGSGVLVPETCQLDFPRIADGSAKSQMQAVVAETCHLDGPEAPDPEVFLGSEQKGPEKAPKFPPLSSAPLLSSTQKPLASIPNLNTTKDGSPTILHGVVVGSRQVNIPSSSLFGQRDGLTPTERLKRKSPCNSENGEGSREEKMALEATVLGVKDTPAFQTHPNIQMAKKKRDSGPGPDAQRPVAPHANPCPPPRQSPRQQLSTANPTGLHTPLEQSWGIEPGALHYEYETDDPHPEARAEGETVDMDDTYVSHSLLLQKKTGPHVSRIGERANDSLADIFDRTTYGEYESGPQSDSCGEEEENVPEDEDAEEEECLEVCKPSDQPCAKSSRVLHDGNKLSFAHVDVVRKKEERRKLKGHTCKECEIYYADLPEEERQKKLTSCSRHRFRYIPPSTPEHFWEVGFPSTQTCVDRGYIKEDDQADARLRRRRPYFAMFSPKAKASKV